MFKKQGRGVFCGVLVLIVFIVYVVRLGQWQLVQGDTYAEEAVVSSSFIKLTGARGEILDRDGEVLAGNRPVYNIIYSKLSWEVESRNETLLSAVKLLESIDVEWVDRLPITMTRGGDYRFSADRTGEIAVLKGRSDQEDVALREASVQLASYGSDQASYRESKKDVQPNAHWQPFGQGTKGYDYADGFNAVAKAEVSGNIGHKTAVSLTPRLSWNDDDDLELKLEEGYVKTKTGIVEYLAGRQALRYGQGKTGTLVLDDTMKPMTMVQAHLEDDMPVRGFFRFLGKQNYHVFYGQLEGDREDRVAKGHTDYDHAGLLGLRADFTPSDAFTFGLMRVSMLGGDGNALSKSDWRHWVTGHNSEAEGDRWTDIAGGDFRVRLPGVQFYGEVYGEDAGGLQPTERGYRFGTYLPQLTRDGSWDMTLEYASTNPAWYVHQKYQNGWTYSDAIIGDSMGNNARKYYLGVNHYLPGENQIGAYFMRTQMDRGAMNHPNVYEAALTGRLKLQDHFFLDGSLGLAKIEHADYTARNDKDVFATAMARWQY